MHTPQLYANPNYLEKKRSSLSRGQRLTFDMLKEGKEESLVGDEIINLFKKHHIDRTNAVYICQNPSFDRSFFAQLVDPEIQESNLWPLSLARLSLDVLGTSLKRV